MEELPASYLQTMLLATRLCPGPKAVGLYGELKSSIYQGWWLAVWKREDLTWQRPNSVRENALTDVVIWRKHKDFLSLYLIARGSDPNTWVKASLEHIPCLDDTPVIIRSKVGHRLRHDEAAWLRGLLLWSTKSYQHGSWASKCKHRWYIYISLKHVQQ